MERPKLLKVAALIVTIAVGLDQLTKWWATDALSNNHTISIAPTLEFDLAHNSGFSFSTGAGSGPWIGLLVLALVGFIIWQIWKTADHGRVILLALILGGAIGNLLDRIFRSDDGVLSGEVIDFIDVSWYAVFNVADVFVVCGSITFVIYELRLARHQHAAAQ